MAVTAELRLFFFEESAYNEGVIVDVFVYGYGVYKG